MAFHSLGFKPRLNKVKASGGCHRFSEEIYRVELDKIWAQIRQGAFDLLLGKIAKSSLQVSRKISNFCRQKIAHAC
ncbi:hypothetical protein [Siminovitchia terrae]|uniref:hypothetical protein n=1 Tax=Siminovitchia terrae TaxID=1914933 RepID=UPI001BB3ACF8|nr:hypothetical protein [Siminovitchia terrae]